jgi:hypothetical protein
MIIIFIEERGKSSYTKSIEEILYHHSLLSA